MSDRISRAIAIPAGRYRLGSEEHYPEERPLREVAAENTKLDPAELDRLLDPRELTKGGIKADGGG